MRRISVGRAIWIGLVWVNGPVLLLLFVPAWTFGDLVERGIIDRAYNWVGLVVFATGFVLAWTWWSFNVPRWRIWAYERVANLRQLKAEAVSYGLTWPDGSKFAKTEIKSEALARREAELDPIVSVVPASGDDVGFAHDLARDNMAATFEAAGIAWDPAMIPATWGKTENYLLCINGRRVGIMRLRLDDDALYVSDLQVAAADRNRGAGTFALGYAVGLALRHDRPRLRLRAFRDSPAVALYEREGFRIVADEGTKLLMEHTFEP